MADESTNALIAGIYASVKDVASNSKQTLAAQAEEQRKAFEIAAATIRKEVGESLARREQTQHRLIVEACGDIAALLRSNLHVLREWRDMALDAAPAYNAQQARIARWYVWAYYLVAGAVVFLLGLSTPPVLQWAWQHSPRHPMGVQMIVMVAGLAIGASVLRLFTWIWFSVLLSPEQPNPSAERPR